MQNLLPALISTVIISLASLAGIITILVQKKYLKTINFVLLSLAIGTLIGSAFLHLIPEAIELNLDLQVVGLGIIGGIFIFFALENILQWRHCHADTSENHIHPVAINNLVADGVHNMIDGTIIGASFAVGTEIGIATSIAILLHEVPQELGDFGVLIHAGLGTKKALLANLASAIFSVFGVIIVYLFGTSSDSFVPYLLALTAGGFIYIATSDLMPELKHCQSMKKTIAQLAIVGAGVLIMWFA